MNENSASIKRTRANYLIYSISYLLSGVGTISPPYFSIPLDAPVELLAVKLRKALNETQTGLPEDYFSNPIVKETALKELAIRSFSQLNLKENLSCFVQNANNSIQITPTQNTGNGFNFKNKDKIEISADAPDEELGKAILNAFERCNYHYEEEEDYDANGNII